jgi:hypothetical protein
MHLSAKGIVRQRSNDPVVRLEVGEGFRFYLWLLQRRFGFPLFEPRGGFHVTLFNPQIHKGPRGRVPVGRVVPFNYSPTLHIGGFRTGKFLNFWLDVWGKEVEDVAYQIGRKNPKLGLHITIGSTKAGVATKHLPHTVNIKLVGDAFR